MTQCLSDAEIQSYVRESLSDQQRSLVDEHLSTCATCTTRIERARGSSAQALVGVHQAPTQVEVTSALDVKQGKSRTTPESHWTNGEFGSPTAVDVEPAAPSVSLDEFLVGLSQSGLLPPSDVASVREKSHQDPATSTVQGVIEWLIQEHKLTRYQADILARGHKGGLVLGNYVILEKLGQGGMGTVFKARHRRMNRLVALKVLPQALSSIPEAIARFQREVEAAARLHHPNIAAAYDADEAGGVHFLVMEYVDGPNLASYVKQRGPVPLAVAVRLTAHAARGLATAHAQAVVHRDIKPSNIMVNRQGVLKILDMGLAQMRGQDANVDLTSDVTQTGRVMGTVDYMAPEQARDAKNVDFRADIYSLGCTLYYLATGTTPAPGGSAAEKLLWHQTQQAPPLSKVCPESTPRLDAVLQSMLAKKAEERPASMNALADELEQCLAELPPADASGLLDGLDLLAEHSTSTVQASNYGQQTMGGVPGDTIVSQPGRSLLRSQIPAAGPKSRLLIYACGIGGALVLALILAAPLFRGAASPGAAAGAEAILLVTVEGGPAEVLINGQSRGRVGEQAGQPLELKVKPGEHLVQVKREGAEPFQQKVAVALGTPTRVAATFKRMETLPLSSPHAPYQKLLTWVFRNQGQVTAINGAGGQLHLTSLTQLPDQPLEILGIKLDGTGVGDADLAELAVVPGLRDLSLADTRISDDGLAHLAELRQLTRLNLSKTGVTSAGLALFARMSQLTELNLERTRVTDPGLGRLVSLARLERLFLSDTGVSDVGVEQLKALKGLKLLTLHGTALTDRTHKTLKAALPEIDIAWDGADMERGVALRVLDKGATLTVVDRSGQRHEGLKTAEALPPGRVSVKEINLGTGKDFSDDDLKQIALLPEIETLSLAGAKISQDGLAHLHGLTTLRKIDLGIIRLPPGAMENLRRALAGCQLIIREPADVEMARQVLDAGGRVSISTERGQLLADISDKTKLPTGAYTLRKINFDDVPHVNDAALERVVELPGLESLCLANTEVTDEGLIRIAGCKQLGELGLGGTQISSPGLSVLAQLPQLSRLYLAKTTIGSEGLRQIGELARLTHLSLQGVKLADDDLAPLKRLEQLEWLDVSSTSLSDAALVHLGRLTKLRELHVTGTELTDAGREELTAVLGKQCRIVGDPLDLQRLAARWLVQHAATVSLEGGKLASVKELPRGACRVLAIDLAELGQLKREEMTPHLAACPDLVSLNLSETKLQEVDLAFLRSALAVSEVRLANLPLSDKTLELLAFHPALEVIDLSGTRVTGQGLAHLSQSSGLKQLLLANTPFDDRHLTALALFPKLEVLDVSATANVTDTGLETVAKLPGLKVLGLRRAKISDAALEKLAKLPELEELDLEGTKITDAGVAKLAGLTRLWKISLSNTQVTDSVTSTLSQMKQLKYISLARTKIGAESIKQLQAELKGCSIIAPSLAPRDPNNPVGAEGVNQGPGETFGGRLR